MGFDDTMRVQGAAAWTAESGLNYARPGTEERQSAPQHPSEVRTPQEALSYIEVLYQSGRMEDLATLLRRRKVFREAWLMLQQSSRAGFQKAAEGSGPANQGNTEAPANLPVPRPDSYRPNVRPLSGAANFKAVGAGFTLRTSPRAPDPGVRLGLPPPDWASRLLRTALKAYQDQDGLYAREQAGAPRLSLRV
jgi:hypothetical protein